MADLDAPAAPTLRLGLDGTLPVRLRMLGAEMPSEPAVESALLQWLLAALTTAEAATVASLHQLNAETVCALARSDTSWFGEHLSDDFVCTLPDGRRLDRARFLRETSERPPTNLMCDEVDVRPLGELGIVHGVVHSGQEGSLTSTRVTHVWLVRDDRWQLVAAHVSRVAASASSQIF